MFKIQRLFVPLLATMLSATVGMAQKARITNPITSGYFADPTIIKDKGSYFIYATIDPWGGKELGVLETKDFVSLPNDILTGQQKKPVLVRPRNRQWFGHHL
jgi:hypothetical protein